MRCLVIGGAGFIGRNLCRHLLEAGHEVAVMDLPGAVGKVSAPSSGVTKWIQGSFTDRGELERAVDACELVFHLASTSLPHTSNEDPISDLESNVGGALRLLDVARRAGVRRIVFASSGGTVYGKPVTTPIDEGHPTEPICAYGIGKLAVEKYLALFQTLHGIEHVVLRIANPYGPGQSPFSKQGAIAVFLHKVLSGETVDIWGDGSIVRDYLYVDDVCTAFLKALEYRGEHRIFNVGSGRGYSLTEIIETVERVVGCTVRKRFLPGRPFDVPSNVLCTERARIELGWKPHVDLDAGLALTLNWQKGVR